KNPDIWQEDKVLLVNGKVSDKDGEYKILCDTAQEVNLDQLKKGERAVQIAVPVSASQDVYERLKSLFQNHPGPLPIHLKVYSSHDSKIVETDFSISHNDNIVNDIENLTGPNSVTIIDKI
ncbi:hypothetical protein KKI23_02410, partial [Patescibacteria group bacterium]|nr:hypothetical protein [Patescibacteria group bacterium]